MFNYKNNQRPYVRPPTLSEYDTAKKEMEKVKKFKKKTYFTLTGDELNDLIIENLAPLTKNPGRFEKFECVAEFEWSNYALYSASVSYKYVNSSFYKKYDRKDIINSERNEMYSLHSLLTFMLEHDIIEEGNYLIDPSW